jgi:thiamine-phosphate pyrophosphorylase
MSDLPTILLITPSSIGKKEPDIWCELFEVGLKRLHLRKPDATPQEVSKLLDQLPEQYHSRIVLHRFPELLNDYNFAGYHHRANEKPIGKISGTTSRSFHQLEELKANNKFLDYVFFGPVYESISKKGYKPRVSMPELGAVLHTNKKTKKGTQVYALGGVRRKKIPELFDLGFDGVALYGSIWGKKDPVHALEKYLYIERSSWGKKEKEQSLFKRLFAPE